MRNIVIVFFVFILVSCQEEKKIHRNTSYSIDLTVMYDKYLNSYKIEYDGSLVILLNEKNEIGKLYKSKFTKEELGSIQKQILNISKIKCDSLVDNYMGGINYILTVTDEKNKIKFFSNNCSNYREVDDFVAYLVKKIENDSKHEYFESTILPTPSPPELETN